MLGPLLLAVGALGAVAFSVWVYNRREARVPASPWLAALRAASIILVLLLVWDPALPAAAPGGGETWVLLDASLSMGVVAEGDSTTPWERARALANREAGRVLLFGTGIRVLDPSSTPRPSDRLTTLAPALRAAAEGGAGRILVISDLRIDDPVDASRVVATLPTPIEVVDVGGELRNAGVVDLVLPAEFGSRDSVPAELVVHAEGVRGDTVVVEVRVDGTPAHVFALDGLGTTPSRRIAFRVGRPAGATGTSGTAESVRVDARVVLDGDAFPPDDARSGVIDLGAREKPLVLISLRPDWEPRTLLPLLEQVTGLQGVGYLGLANDRWLAIAEASATADPSLPMSLPTDSVAAAAMRAELLVLHGVGRSIPEWITAAVAANRRLLVLANAPEGGALVGVELTPGSDAGSWFVDPVVPSSPVSIELAGIRPEPLPPLENLLVPRGAPRTVPPGASVALNALRNARGEPTPVLIVGSDGNRRWALATARGFWRWAIREGEGANAYRRLWSAAAGWILVGEGGTGRAVRPLRPVVGAGEPLRWRFPDDTIRLVLDAGGVPALDSTIVAVGGEVSTPPLAEGSYGWRAERTDASAAGEGTLEVESRSSELMHPRWTAPAPGPVPDSGDDAGREGPGLRTHALPYMLLLGLLFAEWVVRRRRGLR